MKRKILITTAKAAELQGVTDRRIRELCSEGRILGAQRRGRTWMVPKDFAVTPGARGPAIRGTRREPKPAASKTWRETDSHYADAYEEAIARFGPNVRQVQFQLIAEKHLPKRGEGRGKKSDALRRSPTGLSWIINRLTHGDLDEPVKLIPNAGRIAGDDLDAPEDAGHAQRMYDRSGNAEDNPSRDEARELGIEPDQTTENGLRAEDGETSEDAPDEVHELAAERPAPPGAPGDDTADDLYDSREDIQLLAMLEDVHMSRMGRDSAVGGSGYPMLDAMRELDIPQSRQTYLAIHRRSIQMCP